MLGYAALFLSVVTRMSDATTDRLARSDSQLHIGRDVHPRLADDDQHTEGGCSTRHDRCLLG